MWRRAMGKERKGGDNSGKTTRLTNGSNKFGQSGVANQVIVQLEPPQKHPRKL
jgi:hypothetical protein